VPTFRSDLASIPPYVPGKPVEEVAREYGIEAITKLASNECPTEPFPEVIDAISSAGRTVNRYPDTGSHELRHALASHHDVDPEAVWVGSGSSDLLRSVALAVGGVGTSVVFADPSFVMYPINARIAGSEIIAVPLTDGRAHDLGAMTAAVREDTSVVYLCSPNNPTGGHIPADATRSFIETLPTSVLVVVDEAYAEYVTAPDYRSMVSEAPSHPNVLALRTFSKVYGLAGLRVGYGVGAPGLIANLRRTQAPFPVTNVAQAAALASLSLPDRVAERVHANDEGRAYLIAALTERGANPAASQANFVYFEPARDARQLAQSFVEHGMILRALPPGVRVSVGTKQENERFISVYDTIVGG
jgi:histidinol-phosphate aminotransferase